MDFEIMDSALVRYNRKSNTTDVTIPYGIKKIAMFTFEYCDTIKKVYIPDSVTEIDDCAFKSCHNLSEIVVSKNINRIGNWAFKNCINLIHFTISKSIKNIGFGAFFNTPWLGKKKAESSLVVINDILIDGTVCSGNIEIPNNIQKIAGSAFEDCQGITNITIPTNIKSIGRYTFRGCNNLRSIYYNGSEQQWKNILCNNTDDTIPKHTIIHYKDH